MRCALRGSGTSCSLRQETYFSLILLIISVLVLVIGPKKILRNSTQGIVSDICVA